MVDWLLWTLTKGLRLNCMVIFENGAPYLARFYLHRRQTADEPSLYLHYFFSSDDPGFYHSHPWERSDSLLLTGGYLEHRVSPAGETRREVKAGDMNTLRKGDLHRVSLLPELGPTWSLFIAGERTDEWGFHEVATGKFEGWRERNDRLKGDRSVEKMTAEDPRLGRYRAEAERAVRLHD